MQHVWPAAGVNVELFSADRGKCERKFSDELGVQLTTLDEF